MQHPYVVASTRIGGEDDKPPIEVKPMFHTLPRARGIRRSIRERGRKLLKNGRWPRSTKGDVGGIIHLQHGDRSTRRDADDRIESRDAIIGKLDPPIGKEGGLNRAVSHATKFLLVEPRHHKSAWQLIIDV